MMQAPIGQTRQGSGQETPEASDAATRPLSVTSVQTELMTTVYDRLAGVYDVVYGPVLQAGRQRALERMALRPGQRVLEVGVGTGLNATLYPRACSVVGIDLSAAMLEKARRRCARRSASHVRLLRMDATALTFLDGSFDVVYAPYLVSVVPDPVKVVGEMRRVCRRGGRIVILNHFRSQRRALSRIERAVSPLTKYIGWKADLDLSAFLAQSGLVPQSIEMVNIPRIWSLVTCIND